MRLNNDKSIGVVILSRYNSTRLPGKALKTINGKEILSYIIERLEQKVSKHNIIIATSNESTDDPIVEYANRNGINVYRGSLNNVATRFYEAGYSMGWDYAVRINGDNLFLDVDVFEEMIAVAKSENVDFLTNVEKRTFPKGMSVEIVRLSFYKDFLIEISTKPEYYEHVTSFFYSSKPIGKYYYHYNKTLPEAGGIQLALDTIEDFKRSEFIINQFADAHWNYNLKEIFEIIKKYEKS